MAKECIERETALEIAMQYCPDDDGSCSKAGADLREMLDEIEAIPAADVVPVVRCGECEHCVEHYDTDGNAPYWVCKEWDSGTDYDGYCHYGEKKGRRRRMRLTTYEPVEGGIPYVTVKDEQDALQKLAAYEDAEEQGRLVRLPCKVGDTIYVIHDGKIWSGEVYHIGYSDYYGEITATAYVKRGIGAAFEHFGKLAFLTREEAEAALKGERKDGAT